MCIAIYKPLGAVLTDKALKNCWDNNSHGAGFMHAKGGQVIIDKGFMTFDAFLAAYTKILPKVKSDMVLHFRISTGGIIDSTNCHPFQVTPTLGVVHNGILFAPPQGSMHSDTCIFTTDVLQQLPKNFLHNPGIRWMLEESIGASNKLIFLDGAGKATIIHEASGEWHEKCWFSNDSYKTPKFYGTGIYGSEWADYDYGTWVANGKKGTPEYFAERHEKKHYSKYPSNCASCGAHLDKAMRRAGSELCWGCADLTDKQRNMDMDITRDNNHRLDY